ncbi:hypothetical protein C0431_07365 [bacterium]|nr:hypothetical protein [bacterium]
MFAGTLSVLGILVLGALVIGLGAFILLISQRKGTVHPSELTSESRQIIRPLRQAVESFESVIKANPNVDAAKILGSQAQVTARRTLEEASRMMANRDQLVQLARRLEAQKLDPASPLDTIDSIDQRIHEATRAVDQLTLKITQAATQTEIPTLDNENDLDDLVSRLQNISQSFDEVNQSINQTS